MECVTLLRDRLKRIREPCVKAVLLFGSRARGESRDRSDIDLLVLHEGCGIEEAVIRRRYLYDLLRDALGEGFEDITLIDMELNAFLKPSEISSLLLNVYWDAIVVYDETGALEGFLRYVREKIVESGLKRVRDGRSYYWILPEPLKEVKIL
ncbi:MAG: nucleotidyltransferase domain-containing protein [Candidatus Korarchaeum sp.]